MTLTPYRLDQLRRYNNPELFAEIERQAKEIEALTENEQEHFVELERQAKEIERLQALLKERDGDDD